MNYKEGLQDGCSVVQQSILCDNCIYFFHAFLLTLFSPLILEVKIYLKTLQHVLIHQKDILFWNNNNEPILQILKMIFQDDLTEYKNGEDIICPLQMLAAFIHPTTVDQEPS